MRLSMPALGQRSLQSQAYRFDIYVAILQLYIFRRDREVFQLKVALVVQEQRHLVLMCAPFLSLLSLPNYQ